MCLAYPTQVTALLGADTAEAAVGETCQRVVLLTLEGGPPVRVGDWLLVQSGLAVQRLSVEEAKDRQRMFDELLGGEDER